MLCKFTISFFNRLFCLVDLFRPTILEVALVCNSPAILDEIPAAVVHYDLSPDTLGGVRNISGVFKRVGSGIASNKYMYMFQKPVPASNATKKHGFEKLVKTHMSAPTTPVNFQQFKVPQQFFADTVQQDLFIETITQSTQEVKFQYPDKASVDEIVSAFVTLVQSKPNTAVGLGLGVEPFEVVRNPHFLSWVRRHYGGSDLIINGNVSLGSDNVSFHQTSKPDFFVLHKSQDFAAISVHGTAHSLEEGVHSLEESILHESHAISVHGTAHSLEESAVQEDNDVHLVGLAGECKQMSHNEPQTLANMVAVAGYVTQKALKKNLKPHKVCIYGVGCVYDGNSAYLWMLKLNFRERKTDLYEFGETKHIDEQFAIAVHLLRNHEDI